MSSEGKKYDDGKPDLTLLEPKFLREMAKVMGMGLKKYPRDNWKKPINKNKLLAALYRHTLAFQEGSYWDSESQMNHAVHIALNAMFLWYQTEMLVIRNDNCEKDHIKEFYKADRASAVWRQIEENELRRKERERYESE